MAVSVQVDHVRRESFSRETNNLPVPVAAQDSAAVTSQSSLITIIALSIGGVLTVLWAGVLVWIAGYVIGIW